MANTAPQPAAEYTVVARRYRPRQFAELIGQEHVAQALVNALQSGRVAHAYLFTGARGTGKTSAARILAKALNCEAGPTATPCDQCESCLAVASGEDVDVLEIDGASNNKVEEIRDLRQNVGFRPTRSRYKVYIIDEVHMLSTSAFNALLKTLEEPPPHVKFIFATTEVQKIPITILSRCQRFDFAHVGPAKIFEQLKSIVKREGLQADDDALKLVARRAAGSMRDSQSLLDQLLASAQGQLTAEQVHAVLGTAGDERVAQIADAIFARDSATALNLLADAADRGLQLGELTDQLVEYWRGLMLAACGGDGVRELPVGPAVRDRLVKNARLTTLDTVLAGLDVLTTTKARMRGSSHLAVLLEMAVVRLCRLDEVLSVSRLVQMLGQPGAAVPGPVRNGTPTPNRPPESEASKKNGPTAGNNSANGSATGGHGDAQAPVPLTPETVLNVWGRVLRHLDGQAPVLAKCLKVAAPPAIVAPNSLAVRFTTGYSQAYDLCVGERNVEKVQDALKRVTGHPGVVRFEMVAGGAGSGPAPADAAPATSAGERRKEVMQLPLFKKAADALSAQLVMIDPAFNTTPAATADPDPDEV